MKQRSQVSFLTKKIILAVLLVFWLIFSQSSLVLGVQLTDDLGKQISLSEPPQRVVSLVPSITEIIFALDSGDRLQGLTSHINLPPDVNDKEIVGCFFAPCKKKIRSLHPDLIFASPLNSQVAQSIASSDCQVITLRTESLNDSYREIGLLGRIFGQKDRAEEVVNKIKGQLDLIRQKVAKIPKEKRKKVIRLMGRDQVMTPGQDSFQNEFIRLAGGIPHQLDKKGQIVPITKKEWQAFNPQVIYGCGGDRQVAEKFFSRPGWREVKAVQKGKIYWFPCALTCRAATHSGDLVSWLASRIYPLEFVKQEKLVLEEKITKARDIDLDLDYVQKSRIATSRIFDFKNKTLIIDFNKPMQVVSTLEGQRTDIRKVGNHFSPPPCWSLGHYKGLSWVRSHIYEVIKANPEQASFLFTGADMDNLSIQKQEYKDITVYALVTAGVKSNAVRMSKDTGNYYEPGTINIIVLPNMKLSPRAMTRAIITATEAKTAALTDMDIRSAYSPQRYKATGTGTDNILVAEGTGSVLNNAGGHSKLGELIAKAVYSGVQEAVKKQNGLVADRSVFHRLEERKISLYELVSKMDCLGDISKKEMLSKVNCLLLQPKYANFMEAAFSLSDDYQKGLMTDRSAFRSWCQKIATDIAGKPVQKVRDCIKADDRPVILDMALNAIFSGLMDKLAS